MEKQVFTVTLAQLRKEGACVSGYNKLVCSLQGKPFDCGRDTYIRYAHKGPINLLHILESNGVDDCLWALRAVKHVERDRIALYIACDCAEAVLHIYETERPDDNRPRYAVEVARRFADSNATQEELAAASDAAWAAASDASADQAKIIKSYLTE